MKNVCEKQSMKDHIFDLEWTSFILKGNACNICFHQSNKNPFLITASLGFFVVDKSLQLWNRD